MLTKLDGTARGGIALAIARELGLPVKLIGVGESLEDLRPFDPDDFARALSRRIRADRGGHNLASMDAWIIWLGGGVHPRLRGDAPGRLLPGCRSPSAPRSRRVVSLLGVGAGLPARRVRGRLGRSCSRRCARWRAATAGCPRRSAPARPRWSAPAIVLERIANDEGVGCVKIDGGEVWTARSYDEDEVIDAGERVEVVEIRGATALVMH